MSKVLVVYKGNYADEFDFVAGTIDDAWYDLDSPELQGLDLDKEHEVYFGTNEFVSVTIRELVTKIETIKIETDTELKLAKLLGTPFGRIFNVISEQLQELEDQRQTKRNQERWALIPDEAKESYRIKYNRWYNLPYVPYGRPDYQQAQEYRNDRYQETMTAWQEMGMEGYPELPK